MYVIYIIIYIYICILYHIYYIYSILYLIYIQEIFSYTPLTFSFTHPLTDVEYADDTVLIARTNDTLCRVLHLLQHLAARIGFLLNGSKCQLITIHASLPVSLSLVADSDSQCNCSYCAPFFFTTPDISSLDVPLTPPTSAKYLGSFITPTSSIHSRR